MRFSPAPGEAHGVLQVQHFVVQDIRDDVLGNTVAVELPVHHNLAERRIEAAELCAPDSCTPPQARPGKGIPKVPAVELGKDGAEVMIRARGAVLGSPRTPLPHLQQDLASASRVREFTIHLDQLLWRAAAIKTSQKNCGRCLDDTSGRPAERIREPDVSQILAQPDCVREIRIGMEFDDEPRRPSLASKPRENSLKDAFAAGNDARARAKVSQGCFLLTGGGAISFSALLASERASFVPSMASSNVSL